MDKIISAESDAGNTVKANVILYYTHKQHIFK